MHTPFGRSLYHRLRIFSIADFFRISDEIFQKLLIAQRIYDILDMLYTYNKIGFLYLAAGCMRYGKNVRSDCLNFAVRIL